MIKSLILIALFSFSTTIEAQYNRRYRAQPVRSMPAKKPRAPEFNVEKSIGMTFYNIEKVGKKIGLKKTSKQFELIAVIFNRFDKDMKQVKRINGFLFYEGKKKIEDAQKEALDKGDYSIIQGAYKEVASLFETIVALIEEKEKGLDDELEKILSSKQLKKWKKYKINIKNK